MPGAQTTIYVDNGAVNKIALGNRINHFCNIFYFANAVQQMQTCGLIGVITMHRGTDRTRRNRIHPDVIFTKLGCQLYGKRMYCTF
jgi:hypothetical protein